MGKFSSIRERTEDKELLLSVGLVMTKEAWEQRGGTYHGWLGHAAREESYFTVRQCGRMGVPVTEEEFKQCKDFALYGDCYMLMNMINAVVRADGSPNWSMLSMLTGAIVNIILDPVFIFACHCGMAGAAWATAIGQVVSFAISLMYLFRTKTFKLTIKSFIPKFKVFAEAIKLGLSSFITQTTIVVISLVCNIMLAKYGSMSHYGADIPIAVIGIESKVFTVVINVVVGIVLGCQPIICYNIRAKNIGRVKKLYKSILLCTLAVGIIATLLFELAPNAVVGMFGKPKNIPNPDDYWDFAEKTFRIFLALIIFTCTIKMSSIFFQAVGKPVFAVLTSLIRDIICFIPLICIMPVFMGIDGILLSAPIADLIAMSVTVVLTVVYFVKLEKNNAIKDIEESQRSL